MTNTQRPSCLLRIVTGGIVSLISAGASALFLYLLTSAYPAADPALRSLLTGINIPLADDLLWLFWILLPFIFGLLTTAVVGWGVSLVAARIARSEVGPIAGFLRNLPLSSLNACHRALVS